MALYVGRAYLAAVSLTLFGLVTLVVAINLIERAGKISEHAGADTAARLALLSSVEYGFQVLPIACFVGALIAGTTLARSGELLAIQASGLSPRPIWLALLAVGLSFGAGGVACGEWAVPTAMAAAERVQRTELAVGRDKLTRFFEHRNRWFQHDDRILYLPSVDTEAATFTDPVVYRFEDDLVVEIIEAKGLSHDGKGWTLHHGQTHAVATADTEAFENRPLPLKVGPRDLIDVAGNPRHMSRTAVRGLISRREAAGVDATAHRLELDSRLAYPLLGIWMLIWAIPWILNPDRRRSMAVSLGLGVVVIAATLSLTQMFRVLALGHDLPVFMGSWGIVLLSLGLAPLSARLQRRVRERGALL